MIPVFLLLKVVYLRSLFGMNSILILTRPLVFLSSAADAAAAIASDRCRCRGDDDGIWCSGIEWCGGGGGMPDGDIP